MIISDILKMTQEKTIAEIAKDHLEVGEKTARQAMKMAGCYSIVGQRGWFFDESENPENLDKSIYDFVELVKQEREHILKVAANVQTYKGNNPPVPRKRHSFDLDVRLVKQLKLKSVQDDKP
ncbi:hypothetical protein A1A1_16695, partial [Planococcus antarcticus DSM 14505]